MRSQDLLYFSQKLKLLHMRKLLVLPLAFLLASCSGDQKPAGSDSANRPAADTLRPAADTLVIAGKTFRLDSISESEFNKAPAAVMLSFDDGKTKDMQNVQIEPGKLVFTTKSGKTETLSSDTAMNMETYTVYSYAGNLESISQWQVDVSIHEGFYCVLVDQQDGTKTELWGRPIVAPDGKHFIAPSFDIEAGFVVNGFQVFTMDDGKPRLLWKRELVSWGPEEMRWLDENTVVIKKTSMAGDMGEPRSVYRQMDLF